MLHTQQHITRAYLSKQNLRSPGRIFCLGLLRFFAQLHDLSFVTMTAASCCGSVKWGFFSITEWTT